MKAWARRGACHRAALGADPLAPLPTLRALRLLGREIAGVVALGQLLFRRAADAVDHSGALDGRALAYLFGPAGQVLVFVRLQELARVVVGGAVHHAVAVPRPDRHVGD